MAGLVDLITVLISVFVLLIGAGGLRSVLALCPQGWLAWRDACYISLPDMMDWDQGARACDRSGTGMAVPDSQEEHDFLWTELMQPKNLDEMWIGCRDPVNGQLECFGHDNGTDFYTFREGDLGKQEEECFRIVHRWEGKWGDIFCSSLKFVACEMRASRLSFCMPSVTGCAHHCVSTCLLHHVIATLPGAGDVGCARACWTEPRCHSFNLWRSDDQGSVCQLNDATASQANATDFQRAENCRFYGL